jgi:hypothetical protein
MSEPVPRAPLGCPSAATLTSGRTGRVGALPDGRAGALPGPGAGA